MRRLGLAVTLLFLVDCTGSSPAAPAPPTPAPTAGTAAAVFLSPNTWDLPRGGGSLELLIETSAIATGGRVAAHVPVTLRTSSGSLSDSEPRTDATGHARVTWTGTSSATITARAGDVEGLATITVQSETPIPPPTPPGPPPAPNPIPPIPNPAPPGPNPPRPPDPGPPGPALDLVATIIATPANPDANQAVTFRVALSSTTGAALPAISSYAWDVNGDHLPDRTEAAPTTTYTTAGTVLVDLEVHTADNRAVQAQLLVTVGAVPALTATLMATPSSVALNDVVSLTAATASTGNVGTLSYAWDFDGNGTIDQPAGASASAITSYGTIGNKAPKVTVTGSRAGSATATTTINVTAPALSISGLAVTSPAPANTTITFTATVTATSGSVPTPLTFSVDYGNGSEVITPPGAVLSVNHVYAVAGTYKVTVTVTAPDGRTATNTITVVVS